MTDSELYLTGGVETTDQMLRRVERYYDAYLNLTGDTTDTYNAHRIMRLYQTIVAGLQTKLAQREELLKRQQEIVKSAYVRMWYE